MTQLGLHVLGYVLALLVHTIYVLLHGLLLRKALAQLQYNRPHLPQNGKLQVQEVERSESTEAMQRIQCMVL